jgi:hypothetical protein
MKIFKILILLVFAATMIPTIALQDAAPFFVRVAACISLFVGVSLGLFEALFRRMQRKVTLDPVVPLKEPEHSQSPDPVSAPGTPPAGQESRHG